MENETKAKPQYLCAYSLGWWAPGQRITMTYLAASPQDAVRLNPWGDIIWLVIDGVLQWKIPIPQPDSPK